jgi:Ca-activated chloride channel family protein
MSVDRAAHRHRIGLLVLAGALWALTSGRAAVLDADQADQADQANQADAPNPEAAAPIQFSSTTRLVVLHVTVTNRHHDYVNDLDRTAFTILDNGRPQAIELFTQEDSPVTMGLLIDSSISMWGMRDLLIAGATAFADASNPRDELFAIAFNDRLKPALPADRPFASGSAELRTALAAAVAPSGRTALYDAVAEGIAYAGRGHEERKVLVIISDGGDNASRATLSEVSRQLEASNVVIYAVALEDPDDPRAAKPEILRGLADTSGGQTFSADSSRDIERVLRRISADIRHAYTLGFAAPAADGTFHKLSVTAAAPAGDRLTARTRKGYFATDLAAGARP